MAGDDLVTEIAQTGFTEGEWSRLSAEDRIRRCRDLAFEAIADAQSKRPGYREPMLRLAAEWLKLAKEIQDAKIGLSRTSPEP